VEQIWDNYHKWVLKITHEFNQYKEDEVFRWVMPRFWKHVDSLIPENQKQTISNEEAERKTKKTSKALNKMQLAGL
jgi:hypothetical protein